MFLIFWFLNAGIAATGAPCPTEAAAASSRIFKNLDYNQISKNVISEAPKRFYYNYTYVYDTYNELFPRKHEKFMKYSRNYFNFPKVRLPCTRHDRHTLQNILIQDKTASNEEKGRNGKSQKIFTINNFSIFSINTSFYSEFKQNYKMVVSFGAVCLRVARG